MTTQAQTDFRRSIPNDANAEVIRLEGISKHFGGIFALREVSFSLLREIHSIVGHNGAGKSTLMKVLMGALQPDAGRILLHGEPVSFSSPRQAQNSKIAMVWQELANFPNLSITENMLMQRFAYRSNGAIDWKVSHDRCRQYLERISLDLDPAAKMAKLPLAQQQLVEFAKAMSYDPSVLILDEPTSALSFTEQNVVYEKINMIKAQGVAVVFISHKLEEVMSLSDRITVLRDGCVVFTKSTGDLTKAEIVEGIVGKKETAAQVGVKAVTKPGKASKQTKTSASTPTISVRDLRLERRLDGVSFDLHEGEVLGLTGVSGSGISEIGQILFGIEKDYTGDILLNGVKPDISSPRTAVNSRLGYVPKNRKEEGIIPFLSVGDNIVLSALPEISRAGFVNGRRRRELIDTIMDTIDLRPRNPDLAIGSLSGGNQQKGVIARWISKNTRILILDEPTRGVDVGAIAKIYSLLRDMAADGLSVLILSSEFEEVFQAADRVIVLNRGVVAGELDPAAAGWEQAFALAVQ